jgi:hypothetical protein
MYATLKFSSWLVLYLEAVQPNMNCRNIINWTELNLIQSLLHFLLKQILIYYTNSQIFQLDQIFEGSIRIFIYVMIFAL